MALQHFGLGKKLKKKPRDIEGATPTFFDHQVYLKGITAQTRYGLLIDAPTLLRSTHLTLSTENVLAEHKNACFTETEGATPTFFDHQIYLKGLTAQTRYGLLIAAPTPLRSPHLTLSTENVLAEQINACFTETKNATPTFFDHQVYLKGVTAQTRYGLLIAAPTPLRSPYLTLSTENVLAEHKNTCFTETNNATPTPFNQVYLKDLTVQTCYGLLIDAPTPLRSLHLTLSTENVLAEPKNACFTETKGATPTPFDHQVYLCCLTLYCS